MKIFRKNCLVFIRVCKLPTAHDSNFSSASVIRRDVKATAELSHSLIHLRYKLPTAYDIDRFFICFQNQAKCKATSNHRIKAQSQLNLFAILFQVIHELLLKIISNTLILSYFRGVQKSTFWVTKGGPLPFSFDILSSVFKYGNRCFTKYPAGMPDYFKEAFPAGMSFERTFTFEDGGVEQNTNFPCR